MVTNGKRSKTNRKGTAEEGLVDELPVLLGNQHYERPVESVGKNEIIQLAFLHNTLQHGLSNSTTRVLTSNAVMKEGREREREKRKSNRKIFFFSPSQQGNKSSQKGNKNLKKQNKPHKSPQKAFFVAPVSYYNDFFKYISA